MLKLFSDLLNIWLSKDKLFWLLAVVLFVFKFKFVTDDAVDNGFDGGETTMLSLELPKTGGGVDDVSYMGYGMVGDFTFTVAPIFGDWLNGAVCSKV